MREVYQAPAGGQRGEASAALDLHQPAVFRAWLVSMRSHIDDLHAAGEDATRPLGDRDLGRRTAREAIRDAKAALDELLLSAERGLPA